MRHLPRPHYRRGWMCAAVSPQHWRSYVWQQLVCGTATQHAYSTVYYGGRITGLSPRG